MANRPNNHSSEPATKADLNAMKTEIIDAVKDTKKEMMEELTATHEDVRSVRNTVNMLVRSDAAHEAALESLRTRLERVERKVGLAT
jgi:regulator of replication initiation timing